MNVVFLFVCHFYLLCKQSDWWPTWNIIDGFSCLQQLFLGGGSVFCALSTVLSSELLMVKGCVNKLAHSTDARTRMRSSSRVFTLLDHVFCCLWMCQNVQSEAAQIIQWGDAVPSPRCVCVRVCVTSQFVVERKCPSSQQTVLTVCRPVTSQAVRLSREVYRSTLTAWDTDVWLSLLSSVLKELFTLYFKRGQLGGIFSSGSPSTSSGDSACLLAQFGSQSLFTVVFSSLVFACFKVWGSRRSSVSFRSIIGLKLKTRPVYSHKRSGKLRG